MLHSSIMLLLLCVSISTSAPADSPIRVDLPVFDQPQTNFDIQPNTVIEAENYPGGEPDTNSGNFISNKLQSSTKFISNKIETQVKALNFGGPFASRTSTLESAVPETEGFGSKTLSVKENIQNVVAGIFQPKPIVDTISESEKYGNTGDKFYSAGKVIVGGAEGVSNVVNSVLEIPGTFIRTITRAATEKLNNLGGKLIGL
ncbi:uncharacterized protein LOC101736369 [Bombyx mori]|uniref:Uncharacterized protein n=1 Tax=Bombyx mori TaxID=7091 RepID=A0A8R1WMB2_BOMMO|nr:uncharacterized protein LOC101736369 [Bombyx mori]